jgi:AraC family transcriptional regulator of adaptative response/methylated-DNA-[protein]-cysteine methyltransferase
MNKLSKEKMLSIIEKRDSTYDSVFIYGVITTGIFCKPSCTSRHAKTENICFFSSPEEAIQTGFRPCKRCRPMDKTTTQQSIIDSACYIAENADETLSLEKLAKKAKLSPSYFQRLFKSILGISPKMYQNAIRLKLFKSALKTEDNVTDAIYSAGFGSTSRVYGQAERSLGMKLKNYQKGGNNEDIYYIDKNTSFGLLMMAATEKGVCFAQFGNSAQDLLSELQEEFPKANLLPSKNKELLELNQWIKALNNHLSNHSPCPDLPLDLRGTAFQIQVWNFLKSVKEGECVSYSDVAKGVDKPKAIRAAASACAKNKIAILVPCHRVLRQDGSIGGYRWGIEKKQALLKKEGSS